ncbi:AAA family ATPase [Kribbella sp. CA-293567]|uniref:AAA family ATPase n=1 Tax=Kribbella sp. CA-293567 TaxID=3002436 RepID=UPI0022DDCF16|nr:AAA family ATPase [Kribbella sp. CA-293567]WBQ05059.1 AAA family ATPase [Kribbella sp. CA-293567]
MPKDDALRELFEALAATSDRLTFTATTSTALAKELGTKLALSRNPVYVFTVTEDSGDKFTCVAFTLTLDGNKRPATRAEAFGKSLAESGGRLFDFNPFLLVHDYAGDRLLAVSAIELFGAFAEHASGTALSYSGSSSFSLTPNFQRRTIFMYAEVREPTVWAASTAAEDLSEENLVGFLRRVSQETTAKSNEIGGIVQAIENRLASLPSQAGPGDSIDSEQVPQAVQFEYAQVEARDEAVQIEDRIWRMILAAISSSAAVILVGPPGTGKSALVRKAVGIISTKLQSDGLPGVRSPLWATPDESWTSRELIGGETVAEGDIVFRPGWVLRAIAENRWLVLDEANRGDLDRIFGALLTWLAGGNVVVGVESSAEDARLIELGWTRGGSHVETVDGDGDRPGAIRYLAGEDWKLLGTYNALDSQRVFRIGAALGRRFARVPIPPIAPHLFERVLEDHAGDLDATLLTKISLLYDAHYQEEITRLGPALFLGMCNYLRAALHADRPPFPGVDDRPESTVLHANVSVADPAQDISVAEGDAVGDPARATGGQGHGILAGAMDSSLSEAYVLNLGTLLAQLEEEDFEQLIYRVRESTALPEKEIEWVSVMIRALA